MKKNVALLEHPLIRQHIPKTVWYNYPNLLKMLAYNKGIYIKPDTGRQGNGVMRVRKTEGLYCVVSEYNFSEKMFLYDLPSKLTAIMDKRKYIIQEEIDLATHKGCPFDIRMVMQRPFATWELTLTSAKVALNKDAVVTNVSKGAQDYPLIDILKQYDQMQDPMAILRELVNVAHQISNIFGNKFHLRTIGLDMAIDKKGKIWFIEANTQPQNARCKLVNDAISQQKFDNAKQIIKRKNR